MWEEVTVDRDDLLKRVVEISHSGDVRLRFAPLSSQLAAERTAISNGGTKVFYYRGADFELFVRLSYQPRRDRHFACYGLVGSVTPDTALDLAFDRTRQTMEEMKIAEVYCLEPKQIESPLLKQMFELGLQDPRIEKTFVADMPDLLAYRLALRTTP